MTGTSRIIHHKTKNDYLANRAKSKIVQSKVAEDTGKVAKEGAEEGAEKVEVTKQAKEVSEAGAKKIQQLQGAKALDNAKKVAESIAKAPPVTPLIAPATSGSKAVTEVKQQVQKEVVDKPGIFFIGGLELFSLVSSDGISNMATKLPSAENFSWSDEDTVIEEILKRPPNQPIILVGHSLGGDSAVSIANELNSVEHGFRKVDLVVTLDSVGFNNDIIPENVKANLNFIGGSDSLLNDGANIARDNNYTQVVNELRQEGHRELDDSRNVQFKIFKAIESTLKNAEVRLDADKAVKNFQQTEKDLMSSGRLRSEPRLPFDF